MFGIHRRRFPQHSTIVAEVRSSDRKTSRGVHDRTGAGC